MKGQRIMTERDARTTRVEGRNEKRDAGGGSDTILVADQCAMVVAVTGRMLEILGYGVVTARSGSRALDLFDSCRDTLGLVILDMMLFRRTDQKTRDRLHRLPLELPVLVWSGYPPDTSTREILAQGRSGYLQKPFEMDELAAKIRQLLA